MRVLIVKVSALGDVIHALPVLGYLKSVDPTMEIDWLVEESFATLLEEHPLIRKVHRLKTKRWRGEGARSSVRGSLSVIRMLRRERYDKVLDLQGNSKSGLFTLLSGAGERFGFDRHDAREWPNLIATNRKVHRPEADHHVTARSLAIARTAFPSGSVAPDAGPLPVHPGARERVEETLRSLGVGDRTLILLHYGTTWKTKLWPLESWRQLARRLCETEGIHLLLTWGDDGEREAAESIRDVAGDRGTIWPRGSLMDLVALLERADLVVGGDTGPIHIAAAVGTPTVSLFRVTDAARNGPRGDRHRRLQAPLDCSPCLRKACERDEECGLSISAEQVLEGCLTLLGKHAA